MICVKCGILDFLLSATIIGMPPILSVTIDGIERPENDPSIFSLLTPYLKGGAESSDPSMNHYRTDRYHSVRIVALREMWRP